MTADELDTFLATERVCRAATSGPDGPHVMPLWFVWTDGQLWLSSVVRSRRWADLRRDPRVAVVVDAGADYLELRGAELAGPAEAVGDVPRTGRADPRLESVERLFAAKYFPGAADLHHDGRHGWLRMTPDRVTSWDFRKLSPG